MFNIAVFFQPYISIKICSKNIISVRLHRCNFRPSAVIFEILSELLNFANTYLNSGNLEFLEDPKYKTKRGGMDFHANLQLYKLNN